MNTTSNTREDLIRFVDEANKKLWQLRGIPDFDAETLLRETFEKAKEADYHFGIALATLNNAMGAFIIQQDIELANKCLEEALQLFISEGNAKWIANTHCITGIINNTKGNSNAALYHALRGSDYYDNHPEEQEDSTMAYYVIGTVYKDLKKWDEAEKFFLKGINCKDLYKRNWVGRVYSALASIYAEAEQFEKALEFSFYAMNNLKEEKNEIGQSRALTDIGIIYKKMGDYSLATEHMIEALEIRVKYNLKPFMISSYVEISELLIETQQWDKALIELRKAQELAAEINQIPKLVKIYKDFIYVYKQLKDHVMALYYSEKLLDLNAEINKKEIEDSISHLNNSLLKEKIDEIERLKNVELKKAYELIEQKNKDITDSLHYAKHIQQAILTSENYIQKNLDRLNR